MYLFLAQRPREPNTEKTTSKCTNLILIYIFVNVPLCHTLFSFYWCVKYRLVEFKVAPQVRILPGLFIYRCHSHVKERSREPIKRILNVRWSIKSIKRILYVNRISFLCEFLVHLMMQGYFFVWNSTFVCGYRPHRCRYILWTFHCHFLTH